MEAMIQVRVEQKLKDRLIAIQIKHGVPLSELARRALLDIADKMEKAKTPLPSAD